jgi:hypothetical protein
LSAANDVFVLGLIGGPSAGFAFLDCASAESNKPSWVAATVMAAVPKNRRRLWSISSGILIVLILESPWLMVCRKRWPGESGLQPVMLELGFVAARAKILTDVI